MGANGAGKSTFVKILTGAVTPNSGRIVIRGRERSVHSPADARKNGLISVYQEPAVIPDLDIRDNLRLTSTPFEPFRHWLAELGLADLDVGALARNLPLASLRIVDLARALAIEPDILLLDEMTAALPANLTERVLEVVGRRRGGDKSVIYISHRMIEIAAVCDRATVLREGQTVGVVDVTAGSEDRIVNLMLGQSVQQIARQTSATIESAETKRDTTPRLSVRSIAAGQRLADATFDMYAGEVLGMVAPGRARTSCSTCSLDMKSRALASCWSTASPFRSGTRPTRSGRASSTSPPIEPKCCSCNDPCARTSRCPTRRGFGAGD